MKSEQSYYRLPPLTRINRSMHCNVNPARNNKITNLCEYRLARQTERHLSDREVIARINRQMDFIGKIAIGVTLVLFVAVVVAQFGIYKGWW